MLKEQHDDKFDNLMKVLYRRFWDFVAETARVQATPDDIEMFTLAVWLMQESADDFLYERIQTHQMSRRMQGADKFMRWFSLFGQESNREFSAQQVIEDFDIQNTSKWYIFKYYLKNVRNLEAKIQMEDLVDLGVTSKQREYAA